jgi:hypothetical protein
MRTDRRGFIGIAAVGIGAAASAAGADVALAAPDTAIRDRKQAAQRRRRIIFNDDGDDVWHPTAGTPDGFLGVRLKHVLGTQVDTVFYCTTQSFNYHTYRTEVGEVFLSRDGAFQHNQMQALMDAGTDPLELAVEFGHANGIEVFWTLRMNDIHDAFTPPLWPQWKTDHPDALLGERGDWERHPPGSQRRWWSGVDFAREDVRERTRELIEEVARKYDVDGIDLDWLRHPIHFAETLRGEPVPGAKAGLITQLVRDVRERLDGIGEERGRPILLSVRVPMLVRHCVYLGTDVDSWLQEGLLDMVVAGGGYIPFSMPNEELVSLGHEREVPGYPCISASGMTRRPPYGPGGVYGIEAWRAAAANAFAAGADGISLFNLFPAPGSDAHNRLARQVFAEAGEPATLAGKDKLFCLDNAAHLDSCGYTNHVIEYGHCLPKALAPDEGVSLQLPVGENLAGATAATLRIQTSAACQLECRLEGQPLALEPSQELNGSIGMSWLTADVDPETLKAGANRCEIRLVGGAEGAVDVAGVELLVTD